MYAFISPLSGPRLQRGSLTCGRCCHRTTRYGIKIPMKPFYHQADLKAKSTGINRTMSGSETTPTTGGNGSNPLWDK